jgi:hypothetical protein
VLRASAPLRVWQRVLLLLSGIVLAVPLGIATQLSPSPRGMGTHQQLGLPPCSAIQIFGVRCPACGMTTSWTLMVRGHVLKAVQTNSGGAMLAVIAAVTAPWLFGTGIRGRWVIGPPHEMATITIAIGVVVVTLVDWIIRLQA